MLTARQYRLRLTAALVSAGVPVVGVSSGQPGSSAADPALVRIDYAPEATAEQVAQGEAVRAGLTVITVAKAEKIQALRVQTKALIFATADDSDQRNAALGLLPPAQVDAIKAEIQARRADYQAARDRVNAAATVEDVEAVEL